MSKRQYRWLDHHKPTTQIAPRTSHLPLLPPAFLHLRYNRDSDFCSLSHDLPCRLFDQPQSASVACGPAASMGDQSQDTNAGVSARANRINTRSQAAAIASPPGSKTPPSMPAKKTVFYSDNLGNRPRAAEGSEPVDASALAKALKDYGEAGTRRERTPGTSPHRKRQRVYGDR